MKALYFFICVKFIVIFFSTKIRIEPIIFISKIGIEIIRVSLLLLGFYFILNKQIL